MTYFRYSKSKMNDDANAKPLPTSKQISLYNVIKIPYVHI